MSEFGSRFGGEGFVPEPESREKKEAERELRSFEYRDAEGKFLGSVDVEMETADTDLLEYDADKPEPIKVGAGRKMHSIILRGIKDGKPTEVDVLKLANPYGVTLYEPQGVPRELVSYHHEQSMMRAMVPVPETAYEMGILLHELGHADQYKDKRFDNLTDNYLIGIAALRDKMPDLTFFREQVAQILEAIPEASNLAEPEKIERIASLEEELAVLREQAAEAEELLGTLKQERITLGETMMADMLAAAKTPDPDNTALMAAFETRDKEIKEREAHSRSVVEEARKKENDLYKEQYELFMQGNLRKLLMLPMQIMEADATKRALERAVELEEASGVPLLGDERVPAEKTFLAKKKAYNEVFKKSCADSLEDLHPLDADGKIVTSVLQNLTVEAMGSYDTTYPHPVSHLRKPTPKEEEPRKAA